MSVCVALPKGHPNHAQEWICDKLCGCIGKLTEVREFSVGGGGINI